MLTYRCTHLDLKAVPPYLFLHSVEACPCVSLESPHAAHSDDRWVIFRGKRMAGSYVATDLCEQPGENVLEILPIPKLGKSSTNRLVHVWISPNVMYQLSNLAS